MSQTAITAKQQKYDAVAARVDMKLEVTLISVSDVDRAKGFYTRLGLAARRRHRYGKRLPRRPVNAPGFSVFDLVRQGGHGGRAWLAPG